MTEQLIEWLRKACGGYQVTPHAIFRKAARPGVAWPLSANSDDELAELLRERGNFIPLPKVGIPDQRDRSFWPNVTDGSGRS